MGEFFWQLHAADGKDLRRTESFGSKEEAEAYMGREWAALLDEGAESVSLMGDGEVVYQMGLRET